MPNSLRVPPVALLCLGLAVVSATRLLAGGFPQSRTPQATGPAKPAGAAEWKTDDEGRLYREARIPKTEARRVSPDTVRTLFGVAIEVVREDEDYFYYKLFRVPEEGAAPRPAPAPKPAPPPVVNVPEARTLALRPFEQGLPQTGQWRDGFAVADMNGDGFPDIVTPPARKTLRPPAIFLGDGKGTWRPWRETAYPPIGFDYGATAAGDFNGDGHQDLAMAVHLRGVLALLGDGKGGFTPAMDGLEFARNNAEMDKAYPSRSILAADWDRDGRLDLIAQGEGPSLSPAPGQKAPAVAQRGFGIAIYRNAGDGRWARLTGAAEPTRLFGSNLAVGDVNADGRIDVVMASSVIGRQDILALGAEDGGWVWGVIPALPPQAFVRSVAVADFDGDGRDDVALSWLAFEADTWRNGVDVHWSRPDGTWTRTPLLNQAGREVVNGLAAGDVSGDRLPDLAAVANDGRVMLWRARAGGSFVRERAADTRSAGGCRGSSVRIANLDGDPAGELVAMFGQEPSDGPQGCTASGALRAWKVVAARATSATPAPRAPVKQPAR